MPNAERPALVTGGTGFVGSHMVDELLDRGVPVRCLVRNPSRLRWLEGRPVERVEGELRRSDLEPAVDGAGPIFHFAGATRGSAEALWAANHEGTRALLAACEARGHPGPVVFCSSLAAAGPAEPGRPREEDDRAEPISDYGRSKLAAEEEIRSRGDRIAGVILRPVAVYGPRDRDTLPFFRMAGRGLVLMPGRGDQEVQVVYVRDVARAAWRAAERREAAGRTYFIAHPRVVAWRELARAIGRALGRRVVAVPTPRALLVALGALVERWGPSGPGQLDRRRARDLAVAAWTCRCDRAQRELGWTPAFDLDEGLRETANWYRAQNWL